MSTPINRTACFPSLPPFLLAALGAVAINCAAVWLSVDLLESWLMSSLSLGHRSVETLLVLLSTISFVSLALVLFRIFAHREAAALQRAPAAATHREAALSERIARIRNELQDVSPYTSLLVEQLDGSLREIEGSVIAMIERINSVYALAQDQMKPINEPMLSGARLSDVLEEQAANHARLIDIMRRHEQARHIEQQAHCQRIQRLSERIAALAPCVGILADLAGQTARLAPDAAPAEKEEPGEPGNIAAQIDETAGRIADHLAAASLDASTVLQTAHGLLADGESEQFVAKLTAVERHFTDARGLLTGIIHSVDEGNKHIVTQLSEALGHMQFQDVVRQRIEQVQSAIRELDEHLQLLATTDDGPIAHSLRTRAEQHASSYVMEGQRQAHLAVMGGPVATAAADERPTIELF